MQVPALIVNGISVLLGAAALLWFGAGGIVGGYTFAESARLLCSFGCCIVASTLALKVLRLERWV